MSEDDNISLVHLLDWNPRWLLDQCEKAAAEMNQETLSRYKGVFAAAIRRTEELSMQIYLERRGLNYHRSSS
jgi:hypothetical protein